MVLLFTVESRRSSASSTKTRIETQLKEFVSYKALAFERQFHKNKD